MADSAKGRSTRRRQKQSKTIDLEANASKSEEAGKSAETVTKDAADRTGEAATGSKNRPSDTDKQNAKTASKNAESSSTKKGTSIGAMILSGLVGGGLVLGGAGVMNATGNLASVPVIGDLFGNSTSSQAQEATNSQLAALSAQVRELEATSNVSDINAKITGLAAKLTTLEAKLIEASEDAGGEGQTLASQALSTAEAALKKAEDSASQLTALNEKIVESAAGTGNGGIDIEAVKTALSSETQSLADRVTMLEGKMPSGSDEVNAELSGKLDELKTQVGALQALSADVKGLGEKDAELAANVSKSSETLEAITSRLDGLEASVNEKILPSMDKVDQAASAALESQKVARSVSARSLSAVLEQGGRFAGELASAEALVGSSPAISELKQLAETGIQTPAQLTTDFDAVMKDILSAETGGSDSDGILDKFMTSARSLVQVRPAGPVAGDSTAAILSRIEAGLQSGDLTSAQAEWNQLDDKAKAKSRNWADSLTQRIRAQSLIETVVGELSAMSNGEG